MATRKETRRQAQTEMKRLMIKREATQSIQKEQGTSWEENKKGILILDVNLIQIEITNIVTE